MELGRAINYPFKDKDAIVKLLIGGVLNLIPFVNFIVYGYLIRAVRQVMQGNNETLPEWDDWGGDFMRGLMIAAASFIYFLPLTICYCCVSIFATILEGDDGSGLGGLLICAIMPIIFIYIFGANLFLLIGVVRFIRNEDFSDAFLNFGAMYQTLMANLSPILMFVLFSFLVQMVTGFVVGMTFWLCGIGLLISYIGLVVNAHLLGQLMNEMDGKQPLNPMGV